MTSKKGGFDFERFVDKYDYFVPQELIAQKPASPRDSAGILVYDRKTKKVELDTFANLAEYLPKNSVLVLNNTKVLPARLNITKQTGGKARILYTGTKNGLIEALSDRKLNTGSMLLLAPKLSFSVKKQEGKYYYLKPSFPISRIFSVLEKYGKTPIPPYIKHSPLSEPKLRREYQTIFASQKGSTAAPTASLHFTDRLLKKIKLSGVRIEFVTLHVGLGTFAPLSQENIKTGKLHEELFSIGAETAERLNKHKKEGHPIIAVGTTVARTLESAANKKSKITKTSGKTDLFIREGYRFKFVDGIITNFHVPKSSLMMLISALVGRKKLMDLYRVAIRKKFRFFSFGDGMFIK